MSSAAAEPLPASGVESRGGWFEALRAPLDLIVLSALILVALWDAIFIQIRRESAMAVHNAEVNLAKLARASSERATKALEGADQAIRFIRHEYLDHPKDLDIAGYLTHKEIIGSAYQLLSVIGADGFVSYSSQLFQPRSTRWPSRTSTWCCSTCACPNRAANRSAAASAKLGLTKLHAAVCTARGMPEKKKRMLAAGFSGLLIRPTSFHDVKVISDEFACSVH
jgi:hypothetical protein